MTWGDEVIHMDFKCEPETPETAEILLHHNHYYYVQKVVKPEFYQIKTKFD